MAFGPIAQWLERRTHNPQVRGSSPCGPTTRRDQHPLVFSRFFLDQGNLKGDLVHHAVVCRRQVTRRGESPANACFFPQIKHLSHFPIFGVHLFEPPIHLHPTNCDGTGTGILSGLQTLVQIGLTGFGCERVAGRISALIEHQFRYKKKRRTQKRIRRNTY